MCRLRFYRSCWFAIRMNTRRALAFIFCTVLLDVLALGLMIPVLPKIVLGFMAATPPAPPRSSACSPRCGG